MANIDRAVFNELIVNAQDYCVAERGALLDSRDTIFLSSDHTLAGFHLKLVASQVEDWKMHSAWLKQRTSETGHSLQSMGTLSDLLLRRSLFNWVDRLDGSH